MDYHGHLLTRNWATLPPCVRLAQCVAPFQSLQARAVPDFDAIWKYFNVGVKQLFKNIGWDPEQTNQPVHDVLRSCWGILNRWYGSVSTSLQIRTLRKAIRRVHEAGLVFVAIDRNPGRVVCLCIEAWKELQKAAFLQAPRYRVADATRIDLLGESYANDVKVSLAAHVKQATAKKLEWRKPKGASPPFANWTIKQKSKTTASSVPLLAVAAARCARNIVVGEACEVCSSQQDAFASSSVGATRWHCRIFEIIECCK